MRDVSAAKWGFVTRRLTGRDSTMLGSNVRPPRLGDLVVTTVSRIGEHEFLEDIYGRRARMYPGDVVVGAFGNRYATDFYEGYIPAPGDGVHLLTSGGLIGTVASSHTSRGAPTELEVLGPLTDSRGNPLSTDDFVLAPVEPARPPMGTIVVVGSAMNAGKTTATSAIVRGLSRAKLKVGAGKVTGSGSGKDLWSYVDAGAASARDFLDFGMPSTFGYPAERLVATMVSIRDQLTVDGCDAAVLEIADGVLQEETRALVTQLPGFADKVVLAVGDALGAVAAIEVLANHGVTVRAVSGLVTASPLATREAAAATGLPVVTPAELAAGAAVDLLADVPDRPAELAPDLVDLGSAQA
ncbi:MAG TPA: DUF1611 domain-containing protein [Pseudonocardia sp.]